VLEKLQAAKEAAEKRGMNMALTRDFKETIRARVKRDPGFRKALLREGIENFLSGDVETGKIILRDFINATVGFTKLSDATNRSAKSLMRMLGPRGNPQARNLFEIVAYLQHAEGVRFEVRSTRAASRRKHVPPISRRRRPAVGTH
jgi:DNA-binding phage protein